MVQGHIFQSVETRLFYFWMMHSIGIVGLVAETGKRVMIEPYRRLKLGPGTLVGRIFEHNIVQANWADMCGHCGTWYFNKVIGYILGIILPKFHCLHFNPYLVKLISVKLPSSAS